jgi:hypothetical protein
MPNYQTRLPSGTMAEIASSDDWKDRTVRLALPPAGHLTDARSFLRTWYCQGCGHVVRGYHEHSSLPYDCWACSGAYSVAK